MAYFKLSHLLIGLVAVSAVQAAPSSDRNALVPRGVPEPVRRMTYVPRRLKEKSAVVSDVESQEVDASVVENSVVSESQVDVVSLQQTDVELEEKVVQVETVNQQIIVEKDRLRLESLVTVEKAVVVQVVQQVVDIRLGSGSAQTAFAVREITKAVAEQVATAVYQVTDANIVTIGAGSCNPDASAGLVGTGTAVNVAAAATAASGTGAAAPTAAADVAGAPFKMDNQTMVLMGAAPPVAPNVAVINDPASSIAGGNWTCGV